MNITQNNMKYSYVFPGQGSQAVGMGRDLYLHSSSAREVFEEADDILGQSLSSLMFEGPEDDLKQTLNSQPAIMVVSIACWKAWQEILGRDRYDVVSVAGHSLGEYTALVVSGALSFADGLRLVQERGRLMQKASVDHPGAMAAVLGLDEESLEHVCSETGVELANINSDDQMVISGDKLSVAQAMDLALARGARKAISLQVSGAFHSSLMSDASGGLEDAVREIEFKTPEIPIIGNYSGTPINTVEEVKKELSDGLCHCVQWRNSVRYMVGSGVSRFVEFGPSRVLSSLIKRIDKGVEAITLSDTESIRKLREPNS
ncbi:MAG: ACP S-malonyltransferase [SAR202 cluster bacterium]|nr:ACP S-malonyltransferase [SAR202 cluster bacterium]|tara:strand:+ start:1813 stop:2763 length:951 start_codon:yes stop_codon:yes gene_type:complete